MADLYRYVRHSYVRLYTMGKKQDSRLRATNLRKPIVWRENVYGCCQTLVVLLYKIQPAI